MISLQVRLLSVAAIAIVAGLCLAAFMRPPVHRVSAGKAAPALQGNDWINVAPADVKTVSSLKGHVTVVHFWTFECINCKHNLPYVANWASIYEPKDVQVIGIHTPELENEKVPANVRAAVKELGIKYPVLIDGEGKNWDAYHQEAWPTVYVIDKQGSVRGTWTGELGDSGYADAKNLIERLRKE